jgi:phosphoribosylaminoimidazolecarboxamide formyltransferase / IMP cyclohydrolase
VTVRRALLSAYDKDGLAAFAGGLHRLGIELLASGGTARFLAGEGLPVRGLGELTGFEELLGHRVVSLHPAVHGGILARRNEPDDLADLERHGIEPIDLVCVNLYPFERTVSRLDVTPEDAIEQIDIGGPALLRGAAKNHDHVVPICRPEDYEPVLAELRSSGAVSVRTRRALATRAFATTAAYDAAIAAWLSPEQLPERLALAFTKHADLRYGENPHQAGAYYIEDGTRTHLLSRVDQLHGKELSYLNLYDLAAGRRLVRDLEGPACAIVKHASPCGVATAATIEEAYERALEADPLSAFGMVCVLNRPVSAALGERLAERFVDVLFAPGYDEIALEALVVKPGTRILIDRERRAPGRTELDFKRVPGGVLVQEPDTVVEGREEMRLVCGELDDAQWQALEFAWPVCKHVGSNAIVIASGTRTIGIGAGQQSRVDSVRIAIEKAGRFGHELVGSVLASDALFPFPDGPELALERGVAAIVQPGGAKNDEAVIDAVRARGAAMVFTGRRHFRH